MTEEKGKAADQQPGNGGDQKSRGKTAWLAWALLAFALWFAGAWILWHLSLHTPPRSEDEKSEPFELMPRAEGS